MFCARSKTFELQFITEFFCDEVLAADRKFKLSQIIKRILTDISSWLIGLLIKEY